MRIFSPLLLLTSCFLLSFPSFAWDADDHRIMTRLALEDVTSEWGLNRPCEVRPLQSFLKKLAKLRPEIGNRWHFSEYLKINPKLNLETKDPSLQNEQTLTPLEILSIYSTDPDDGRDQDLFVRDQKGSPRYIYPDQKWFGVMQGPDSQAFRHIEKPPFSWKHPLSTFGIPLRALGESTTRAEIYFQASVLAFSLDEEYWGWRFLAGAFHYLEDLHNPYHAGQITLGLLTQGLWAYLNWGYKEKGLMGTLSQIVSNSHRFFESYLSHPRDQDQNLKRKVLASLKGNDTVPGTETIRNLAVQVRDQSNRDFIPLVCAVSTISDPILRSNYRFNAEGNDRDDPTKFLKEDGTKFEKANEKIFEISLRQFESAGRVIRTAVQTSLQNQGSQKPKVLIQKLDILLNLESS